MPPVGELDPGQHLAFTAKYEGRVSLLKTQVGVAQPILDESAAAAASPTLDFTAICDTGATHTVVTKSLADQLTLPPIGKVMSSTVGGVFESAVYLVSIFLPNRVCIPSWRVCEGQIKGADVLIGMDIIGGGDLAVTAFEGKTTLSLRVPSQERIDFVEAANRHIPKVGRNEPCPCGSGKKYKSCHGK